MSFEMHERECERERERANFQHTHLADFVDEHSLIFQQRFGDLQ